VANDYLLFVMQIVGLNTVYCNVFIIQCKPTIWTFSKFVSVLNTL